MTTASMTQTFTSGWERTARLAIGADAAASGALGVLLIAAAAGLDSLLGIRFGAVVALGVVLVLWAADLMLVMRRPLVSVAALRGVVGFNAVWVAGSAVIGTIGWEGRTTLGVAFLILQAAAGGGFGVLQYLALRQAVRSDA